MVIGLNGSGRLNLNGNHKDRVRAIARETKIRERLAAGRLLVSDRISSLPAEDYPRIGYGMFPPKVYDMQVVAVSRLREFILSGEPQTSVAAHVDDLGHIGKIFDRAQAACFGDWFRQSASLGYPSHLLARRITESLASLQSHLADGDKAATKSVLDFLHDEAVTEMLENWIAVSKGEKVPVERGWAYLAWKSDRGADLIPGADAGSMRSILDQMENNGRQKGSNYGLVRAWLVHDPELASESLGEIFAESSANSGANSLDLGRMSDAIESALLQSDNLVLSPWHVDDEHAFDRLGLSGFQPIGEPEQNAEPAAFRR